MIYFSVYLWTFFNLFILPEKDSYYCKNYFFMNCDSWVPLQFSQTKESIKVCFFKIFFLDLIIDTLSIWGKKSHPERVLISNVNHLCAVWGMLCTQRSSLAQSRKGTEPDITDQQFPPHFFPEASVHIGPQKAINFSETIFKGTFCLSIKTPDVAQI